jgi:hypothetical protein
MALSAVALQTILSAGVPTEAEGSSRGVDEHMVSRAVFNIRG